MSMLPALLPVPVSSSTLSLPRRSVPVAVLLKVTPPSVGVPAPVVSRLPALFSTAAVPPRTVSMCALPSRVSVALARLLSTAPLPVRSTALVSRATVPALARRVPDSDLSALPVSVSVAVLATTRSASDTAPELHVEPPVRVN